MCGEIGRREGREEEERERGEVRKSKGDEGGGERGGVTRRIRKERKT